MTRDAAGVTLAASLADEVGQLFRRASTSGRFSRKGRECASGEVDFVDDPITGRLAGLQIAHYRSRRQTEDEFLKAEMQELGRRISDAREGIAMFLEQSAEVMCIGSNARERRRRILLAQRRADRCRAGAATDDFSRRLLHVMTSATLAVGQPDLSYFRRRIGAIEAEPLQLGSPFDFRQMKFFVVQKMPDPRDAGYGDALAEWVAHFVEETDGRAFVLFTSYRAMQQLADEMEPFFASKR